MDVGNAIIAGLRPVRGSARLLVARWLLWIVAAAPGVVITIGALGDEVGRRPYFADAGNPLPFIELFRMLGAIPGIVWGSLIAGAAIAWLGNLLLTAGAVAILDPKRTGSVCVMPTAFETGSRAIWAYLRIALLAFLAIVIGNMLLGVIFDRIVDHGAVAGWTGKTLAITLPGIRLLLLLLWVSLVGAFAWWCRVIIVADGRRYVRRLLFMVPRLWWRHPIQALAFHVVVSIASLFVGAAVLLAWRQSGSGPGIWLALHLVVLALYAFVWHWRLRACTLVWAGSDLADLREKPDASWRVPGRLIDRVRRRDRKVTAAPAA